MPSRRVLASLAALAVAACAGAPPRPPRPGDLTTEAERSGDVRTGRYDEVVRLCDALAAAHPGRARCERFGETAQGRPLVAIVAGDPAAHPTLLIQGGIHAGEIEGKDAGLRVVREVLAGTRVPGALDRIALVFVPVINPDGHERFGPNHRPNQRGPERMGFRTTAANLNLNRDHVKADAPEMVAGLGLWRRYDPIVYVDLHTTDGAKFQHDVAVQVAPRASRAGEPLAVAAAALSRGLQADLTAAGHLPLDFYPSFVDYDDPASGFEDGEPPPRFSQGYAATRGRLGVLVETHSWRTYRERVATTVDVLTALLTHAADDAPAWRAAADAADRADAALAGTSVPLTWKATDQARTIEFRGYRYERRPSEVSGGTWTIYDEGAPEIWRVPLRDELVPEASATAPAAGYLVEAGWAAAVAARLDAHALRYERLAREVAVDAEVFRVRDAKFDPPYEGRTRVQVGGAWTAERRVVAPGALWIPIAQPRARLLLHLLEPASPDSLVRWGAFNGVLEQKEYMEGYVAEEIARAMLKDVATRAEFEARLKGDAAFAASAEQRLDFFYRRHPAWDERKDLLPIYRLAAPPR